MTSVDCFLKLMPGILFCYMTKFRNMRMLKSWLDGKYKQPLPIAPPLAASVS